MEPKGSGSVACFDGDGRVNVNDSGEGVGDVYGQTTA
jgi:hypothetical protein